MHTRLNSTLEELFNKIVVLADVGSDDAPQQLVLHEQPEAPFIHTTGTADYRQLLRTKLLDPP